MSPNDVVEKFRRRFGSEPELIAMAPGRINLIGEHTDYNEGFVFPMAIDRITVVAASKSNGLSEVYSDQSEEGEPFHAAGVEPGALKEWAKYPAGVAWVLRQEKQQPVNLKAYVTSTIPMGSGVSSSAAIELAFLVLQREYLRFDKAAVDLAKMGQICENKFVGVNSGIMDQMACAMGRMDSAIFIDTRSLEVEYAQIPGDWIAVLCDTKKPRALTDSAYNERRSQCEEASAVLGVKALRDATMPMLEAKREALGDLVYRRAKHVISEDERTKLFKHALERADRRQVGELMRKSHESLRDDYEVSCFELDVMAEAAWNAPGCIGARMTGAGFGGACIALVEKDAVSSFIENTLKHYQQKTNREGEAIACKAVDGAHILER